MILMILNKKRNFFSLISQNSGEQRQILELHGIKKESKENETRKTILGVSVPRK